MTMKIKSGKKFVAHIYTGCMGHLGHRSQLREDNNFLNIFLRLAMPFKHISTTKI
jgi:hypothetical protein